MRSEDKTKDGAVPVIEVMIASSSVTDEDPSRSLSFLAAAHDGF
jgi:hypothetical protein